MKKFLRTAMAIACLLSLFMPMQAQDRAGATEEEYGNIVVYLETAKWGQGSPYNKLCFTGNGSQAITGCVPTAYAILMNYHKWPAKANEKRVYHSGTGESITLGHVYDWDNMLSSYSGTYTDEEANAVATLMRDLGWAYGVEYGTGNTASGAGGEGAAKLIDIFKYKSESPNTSSATMATNRDVLANDNLWVEYIKQSLDAGCPIPYSSTTTGGGRHIFILDGYTDKGYFHFNWGWNGQGNGWFKLDEMKPDAYSDYSKSHRAYFMLKPDVATYTISVAVNEEEAGSAAVNDKDNVTVNEGASITLTATANEGYVFVNWTLNGEEVSSNSTYTTTATADAEYTANFKESKEPNTPAEVTIKTESTIGGNATVNGMAEITVTAGSAVSLEAFPDEGYIFVEWRNGIDVVSTNAFFSTTAQSDKIYTAIFIEKSGTVTIEVKGSGGYAYVGNGTDRKLEVEKGSTVSIRAAAVEGSGRKFAYWSTGNTIASGKGTIHTNKNPYEFTATEDAAFFVNFVTEDTDLNVTIETASTEGGTATIYGEQKQTIALGSEIVFEAKANEGYKFTEWTKGTDVVSKEPIFTTVAREAMVITANFEKLASTNIVAVAEDKKEQHIYDLSGRRVEKITIPGVYVVNGMTVVIKK
ncbi:MAG: C10 family peptidase [Bacteroidaceae bacterium]|nr:C10 family peptidase [Bacteroidaceae bacterium]